MPGNKIASGSWDNTIKIWDIATGKCERTLLGHENSVNALCLLPGNKIASGLSDNTIKIWDNPVYSLIVPDEEEINADDIFEI